jgi:ABC-type branched-subunit amino acid transport system substrate-binding protein
VVLPLSGRYARYGEATLQGILLATGHFDPEQRRPSGIRLIIRDTGGDPARAAAAVRELAASSEVSAVLGPMLAAESEAAAAVAQELRLPLLTLSQRETVGAGRDQVLRLGETPRLEAELMAAYAVETLGLKRFAILYPNLEFGLGLRSAFWDAVEARGGEVVGVARYEPDATDFSAPVRRLIGYELLTFGQVEAIRERDRLLKRAKRLPAEEAAELRKKAREVTGPRESPLPPFVDFEALFIPDTYETVGLIAPHLAFHEVRGVRLLGTSPWNDPELLRLGGRHVNGAVFTAGSFGASERPHIAEYQRRFEAHFDRSPGDLAAAAFDAANLAVVGLARAGTDRDAWLRGLRALDRWSGVSGTIGFGSDGKPWKRPHLLGVERGELISVDERGEPPYLRRVVPLVCELGLDGEEVCVPAPNEEAGAGIGGAG